MSLYEEAAGPRGQGFDAGAQERSSDESSFLEESAGDAVGGKQFNAWLNRPAGGGEHTAPESPDAASLELGTYQPRLVWMGTEFEERQVLILPSQPAIAGEPHPAPVVEAMSVATMPENTMIPQRDSGVAEAADMNPEPQLATIEEASGQALPRSLPDDSLPMTERETAGYSQSAVAAPASSNGAKTLPDAQVSNGMRWFVLNGMLGGAPTTEPSPADASAGRAPVLEIFSLAGGVGKTSLAATLGRALSARGERVLLVEATPFGSLSYFFGACDCRPGVVRTFRPPASSSDAPIRLATLESESLRAESAEQGSLAADIQEWAQGASRVIVDVATGSTAAARGLSPLSPTVLVPLVPDVSSVIAANSIDRFFQRRAEAEGIETEVYYVLNQFDASLPLHAEVGKVLRGALGERLLPFALERNPAVSEALADGMTIIDYAPGSPLAEDYIGLAKWVEMAMAPARTTSRGARWSER